MDRPNTDICADHIERMLREHGAVGHAGLVLREHYDKAKKRIAELEVALREARGMLRGCGFDEPDVDQDIVDSWNRGLAKIDAALGE